ncbi:MAG: nitrogenase [Bacteroidota bacterium]|nr:MAG: nitrogenase [Bacteroidota bacterium]
MNEVKEKTYTATRNACKLCTPLGASIAFKGIEGCVPLIHGSQGCSTYIRRYLISHYKEPVDIASTNFTEESAIFGGENNLFTALKNITSQYKPDIIGIATTCLSETIGDDMQKLIGKYKLENSSSKDLPSLVYVNTPSYSGTHADGFHNAILALVRTFACSSETNSRINLFPGFLSPADIRHLKEITDSFGFETNLLSDYSEILDNGYTGEYERIPKGGTPLESIRNTASARATIEFGYILNKTNLKAVSAGEYLEQKFSVPRVNLGIPIGINETDYFFSALENLSGCKTPEKYKKQRARLVDAYVDGHKYLFGKRAVVYGEEDFVAAMVSFLEEIGIETVLCATGGNSGILKKVLLENILLRNEINVHENYDFEDIKSACAELRPDLLIGNSKAYYIARELEIPLVRVGFPIHDRVGGQRLLHVGYEGTQQLFDSIANALIDYTQAHSPVGYKYM